MLTSLLRVCLCTSLACAAVGKGSNLPAQRPDVPNDSLGGRSDGRFSDLAEQSAAQLAELEQLQREISEASAESRATVSAAKIALQALELQDDARSLAEGVDELARTWSRQQRSNDEWRGEFQSEFRHSSNTGGSQDNLPGGRKLLESGSTFACPSARPEGPLLRVDGECSCSDDLLIGGRSVTVELDALNASLRKLAASKAQEQSLCDYTAQWNPRFLGFAESQFNGALVDVEVSQDGAYAFLPYATDVAVLDLRTNRWSPVQVADLGDSLGNDARSIRLSRNRTLLYVTSELGGELAVFDVTNPKAPVQLGLVGSLAGARGIVLSTSENFAFVLIPGDDRITVVNISNPASMSIVSTVQDSATMAGPISGALSTDGTLLYVAASSTDALVVLDVDDVQNPQIVGSVANSTHLGGANDVVITSDGTHAFVACYDSSAVAVVDISTNTLQPILAGVLFGNSTHLNHTTALELSADNTFLFAATAKGTAVLDVSNPPNMVMLGIVQSTTSFTDSPQVTGIALSPDEDLVYAVVNQTIAVTQFWQFLCFGSQDHYFFGASSD